MRRHPMFDPPEYVQHQPQPALLREYLEVIEQNPARRALIEALSTEKLEALYQGLVRNRLHDIALKRWVKQGVITKAWLGTGEEATTIGAVHALQPGDVVAPMIRNAGACHEKGMPLADLFRGYLATQDSPTRGRDLHIGDLKYGLITPISHVAAVVPVTVGVALGFKLQKRPNVALTWVGDGSSKNGDFHEGVNLAAAQQAPAIIILQNNQVALGTRLQQHHRGSFLAFAQAYGMPGALFHGNHVLDAYAATREAADRARAGEGPTLLVAETFRMGGHATHDEREARECFPAELFTYWGQRDPIALFEEYLISTEKSSVERLSTLEALVSAEVDAAAEEALQSRNAAPVDPTTVSEGVYA